MLQSTGVAIDDDLRGTDVVPQRGQPGFRDRSGLGLRVAVRLGGIVITVEFGTWEI
jgi:hypothetical protein